MGVFCPVVCNENGAKKIILSWASQSLSLFDENDRLRPAKSVPLSFFQTLVNRAETDTRSHFHIYANMAFNSVTIQMDIGEGPKMETDGKTWTKEAVQPAGPCTKTTGKMRPTWTSVAN